MKAYIGFNKDMTCRGFQYKEGETENFWRCRTMRRKVKDFVWSFFFLAFFVFAGSGMLECCILKLMDMLGW